MSTKALEQVSQLSPPTDASSLSGREPDESPRHTATFSRPLAFSSFQVIAAEFDAYIKETGVIIADGDERPGRACVDSKPRYNPEP